MLWSCLRVLFVVVALLPEAQAAAVAIVLSDSKGPYAEFSAAFGEALDGSSWKISASGTSEIVDATNPPDLIVAVGSDALRRTLARGGNTPVIATLIQHQAYDKILAEAGRNRPRSTAVFLEQPPARQAAFIRHLLPGQRRIGLVYRSASGLPLNLHTQALGAAGFTVDSEESQKDNELLPALNALLPRVNVLLALPDPNIFKRDNIKAILVTTFRYQKPLIAFSPTLVNAGALAALYTTPAQIARQTAELILTHGTSLPTPRDPSQFAIAINQNVAQSLNLTLPDEATLRRALLGERDAR